jgi:hypothetical protein
MKRKPVKFDYEAEVSSVADAWNSEANRLAMSGIFVPFNLYYRESTATQPGALYMVPDMPDHQPDPSWQLASGEPFRGCLNREQVRARIWELGRRLPLLPFGGV